VETVEDADISQTDRDFLKKHFNLVFNFLKSGIVDTNILYKNSKVVFIKALKELEYFTLRDIKIPLLYYHSSTTDIKFYHLNKIFILLSKAYIAVKFIEKFFSLYSFQNHLQD